MSDTGAIPRVGDTGAIPRVPGPRPPAPPAPEHAPAPSPGGVRGGHPQHAEPGPPRPRAEYVDAFEAGVYGGAPKPAADTAGDDWAAWPAEGLREPRRRGGGGTHRKRNRARYSTGIAAAVTAVAVGATIAVQVITGPGEDDAASAAEARARQERATRSQDRDEPAKAEKAVPAKAAAPTYAEAMAVTYPLSGDLTGPDTFTSAGPAKAPGKGRVIRYRVDIERGLPLDGELFAQAVHKTLNDRRSWGGGGDRTFERVGADGKADFVVTLASPGTTDKWCAKSGLDTSEQRVSCDAATTDRVMINAYRWAQGSTTYGDEHIHAYRQMLINHEVGHRLGWGHVGCEKAGELAPVMMQQTKYLTTDGRTCRPNPWPYPER